MLALDKPRAVQAGKMDDGLYFMLPFAFLIGTFWLFVYCYGLYKLGRAIAQRYRTRHVLVFTLIALGSSFMSLTCMFLPLDIIWKSTIVFAVWITHTQAIGAGFWGGMEIGKKADAIVFKKRAESWLKEWEEPVQQPMDGPE
jgi:hypothetical protein